MKRSRARYGVVGFCFALAMVTYIDRACIGVLAGAIRADLGLSMTQMGYVFSAFTFAYAIIEIPSAWWGEKIGARRVLARIVAWWSAFTMLTSATTGFVSLWLIRFLFGAGEAGAWPNATRVFSRWIPVTERGRVQGIFFAGAHLAAGLRADWTPEGLAAAESLIRIFEARATAHASATLIWPGGDDDPILPDLEALGAVRRPNGLLAPVALVPRVAERLTAAGRGPVTASRPDFVFETACPPWDGLRAALIKTDK